MASDNPTRRAGVWLLRRGYLSFNDIGQALGVARQTVRWWAQSEKVDYKDARAKFIKQCRKRAIRASKNGNKES